jgi:hypothetical protein
MTGATNMFTKRLVNVFLPIVLLITFSVTETSWAFPTAEDFGYNSTNPVVGEKPLLTILVNYSDADFRLFHTPSFYANLLFGEGEGVANVAGVFSFFQRNSYSNFRFRNVGILGPFLNPDNPDTPVGDEQRAGCAFGETIFGPIPPVGDPSSDDFVPALCGTWHWNAGAEEWENQSLEAVLANAIINASNNGFPFGVYDTDGDGFVTADELIIYVISAKKPTSSIADGGTVRNPYPRRVPVGEDINVAMSIPNAGEDVGAMTLAHELTHQLHHEVGGSYEAYGAIGERGYCLNYLYTTLSCTIFGVLDDRRSFNLDPFAKMKLGWLLPELLSTSDSVCLELAPGEIEGQTYLIYDDERALNEFFLLEYREPAAPSICYDCSPWGSRWRRGILEDGGLAIWFVRIDDSKWPLKTIYITPESSGFERDLRLIPPGLDRGFINWGNPNIVSGIPDGLWGVESGTANPTWRNGSDSGFFARVFAKRYLPGSLLPRLLVEVGTSIPSPCFYSPPAAMGVDYVRESGGVDRWSHTDFILERETTLISPQKEFDVFWSFIPLTDRVVNISIVDSFPDEFVPLSQNGTSISFDQNPGPGQAETHQYLMQAATNNEGQFTINTNVTVNLLDSNGGIASEEYNIATLHPVGSVSFDGFDLSLDHDGDGIASNLDNCIFDYNSDQADNDNDGLGDVCDDDDDNDGVPDEDDKCTYTTADDPVNESGCSIGDLCNCNNEWKNHGEYVSCVAKTAGKFLEIGLITEEDKDAIVTTSEESTCGDKTK